MASSRPKLISLIELFFFFRFSWHSQASFSSGSSYDLHSSSQQPLQPQQQQQSQPYFLDSTGNLDIFSDISFGSSHSAHTSQLHHLSLSQSQPHASSDYTFSLQSARSAVDHSNSSSETLVGNIETGSHFGSDDSIPGSLISPFHQESQVHPITPVAEQEKKLFFDRSTSEELGLSALRSNSDPTIALHSLQSRQQHSSVALTDISHSIHSASHHQQQPPPQPQPPQPQPPQQAVNLLDPQSTLPSFQETYSIKYNQLASFGLKMDEECYNIAAAQHHAAMSYQHGHGHQHAMAPEHYEYQPNPSQFISPNFYPYEQQSMVRPRPVLAAMKS